MHSRLGSGERPGPLQLGNSAEEGAQEISSNHLPSVEYGFCKSTTSRSPRSPPHPLLSYSEPSLYVQEFVERSLSDF